MLMPRGIRTERGARTGRVTSQDQRSGVSLQTRQHFRHKPDLPDGEKSPSEGAEESIIRRKEGVGLTDRRRTPEPDITPDASTVVAPAGNLRRVYEVVGHGNHEGKRIERRPRSLRCGGVPSPPNISRARPLKKKQKTPDVAPVEGEKKRNTCISTEFGESCAKRTRVDRRPLSPRQVVHTD